MIRMAYLDDPVLNKRIKETYVLLMNTRSLGARWSEAKGKYAELTKFNFSIKELISAPFGDLVMIAKAFDNALKGADDERKKEIRTMLATKVFRYDTYQRKKIASFFREHAEDLRLHTCHYCDLAYINTYEYIDRTDGHRRRASHFDLDHVLEKSDYPLLALSLYNMVPSCPTCNERLKGKEPLSKVKRMLQKFSPTCPSFEFDRKVCIELLPLEKVRRPFVDNAENYEIDFDCHKDKDYEKYIELFRLKERYNYHKGVALRLKDLQLRYPDTNIANIATMLHLSFDEVKEDIFGQRFVKEQHRCFGKMRRDMMRR